MTRASSPRRTFLAPEVIQLTAIDCGPACLKSALQGYGIRVRYEALRQACQTDVDGTSLDALHALANELGLVAEKIWVPLDHLSMPEISPLPALCVVPLPGGLAHFVLAWRRVGAWVQIMDPSSGRRWVPAAELAGLNHPYEFDVPGSVWRRWASKPEFDLALLARLRAVGGAPLLLDEARRDDSPAALACLDAATRMVTELCMARGVRRGEESGQLLAATYAEAMSLARQGQLGQAIPSVFFSAYPSADGDQVRLRGAIVLRFRGRREDASVTTSAVHDGTGARPSTEPRPVAGRRSVAGAHSVSELRPLSEMHSAAELHSSGELSAITQGPNLRVWREAFRVLCGEGRFALALVGGASFGTAWLTLVQVLLLRGLMDIGARLQAPGQRWGFLALLLMLVLMTLAVDCWSARAIRGFGRRFELRLRVALLSKIPKLADRYFRTRPASDLAHRAHLFHIARVIPELSGRALQAAATLIAAVSGLIWLDPAGAPLVLAAGLTSFGAPWLGQKQLNELDLKVRLMDVRLAQFNLDALLGLVPIRAHGAERAVRQEHGAIILEWVAARAQRQRLGLGVDALQLLVPTLFAVLAILSYVRRTPSPDAVLLVAYWALSIPELGQRIAAVTRQLPAIHSILGRLLEPIASGVTLTPAEPRAGRDAHETRTLPPPEGERVRGVELRFEDVSVTSAGRHILAGVSFDVAAGEHVAVVGASGAGKSTLLGLLLGWVDAPLGRILVDHRPLDVAALRRRTAWVDPAVTLWNRSLVDNVRYGSEARPLVMSAILEQAELIEVVGRLKDGLQAPLGETGRLVSGGEGQRVRLARALSHTRADLVLLDEPFRGLQGDMRQRLLGRARQLWGRSTLLCVTHDIAATLDFDRVLVVDGGRIVENGPPEQLLAQGGRFAELLEAERVLHREVWAHPSWRRLVVRDSAVHDGAVNDGAVNDEAVHDGAAPGARAK